MTFYVIVDQAVNLTITILLTNQLLIKKKIQLFCLIFTTQTSVLSLILRASVEELFTMRGQGPDVKGIDRL